MKYFFCILLLVSVAQAQNTFVKTIGSWDSDYGTSCKLTVDKGTILAVSSADASGKVQLSLVKTDHNGTPLWDRTYQIGDYTYAGTVLQSSDGGYLVYGSTGAGWNDCHLFLLKTDATGNQQWLRTFSLSQNDKCVSIVPSLSGGYISCSVGDYNLGTYPRTLITWYDSNGMVKAARSYGTPIGTEVRGITSLKDGGVAFVAFARFELSDMFPHTLITCTDAKGDVRWSGYFKTFYDDEPWGITSDAQDNIYATGRSYFLGREWDGFFLKLNRNGAVLNNTFYNAGTSNGEIFRCIIPAANGGAVIAGDLGTFDERDISLLYVNGNGGQVWAKRYPFSPGFTNYPYELYKAYDNGYVLTGDVRPPAYYRDALLVKTDANGGIPCYDLDMNYSAGPEQFEVSERSCDTFSVAPFYTNDSMQAKTWTITPKLMCEDPLPVPDFSWLVHEACTPVCVDFADASLSNPVSWHWEFAGADTLFSDSKDPADICYLKEGSYSVKLTISNAYGSATKEQIIHIHSTGCPELPLEIPNIFSPNGDGLNEEFMISGLPDVYSLKIYSRWGNEVFSVSNTDEYWNGKDKNSRELNDGIYYYILRTSASDYKGYVRLAR